MAKKKTKKSKDKLFGIAVTLGFFGLNISRLDDYNKNYDIVEFLEHNRNEYFRKKKILDDQYKPIILIILKSCIKGIFTMLIISIFFVILTILFKLNNYAILPDGFWLKKWFLIPLLTVALILNFFFYELALHEIKHEQLKSYYGMK